MSVREQICDPVVFRWQTATTPADWEELVAMCHGACLALIGYNTELSEDYADLRRIASIRVEYAENRWEA